MLDEQKEIYEAMIHLYEGRVLQLEEAVKKIADGMSALDNDLRDMGKELKTLRQIEQERTKFFKAIKSSVVASILVAIGVAVYEFVKGVAK